MFEVTARIQIRQGGLGNPSPALTDLMERPAEQVEFNHYSSVQGPDSVPTSAAARKGWYR